MLLIYSPIFISFLIVRKHRKLTTAIQVF